MGQPDLLCLCHGTSPGGSAGPSEGGCGPGRQPADCAQPVARIADEQSKERKTRLALLPVQPYSVPLPAACKSIVESQIRTLCALQAVDARCNPDHLLFATPDGRPVEANVLREHLALLERRAGVPCLTFSAIRETAIRQALEDGGTAAEVMERFHCKDRQAFLRRYRQK